MIGKKIVEYKLFRPEMEVKVLIDGEVMVDMTVKEIILMVSRLKP